MRIRSIVRAIVAGAIVSTVLMALPASPASAWCYLTPISATLDWDYNGSDAHINWGGGDVAFSPTTNAARAVRDITGSKRVVLNAYNDTVAGWTARHTGNQVNDGRTYPYGAMFNWQDSKALTLAKELRPCT